MASSARWTIDTCETKPFGDQKPGTSGLRKPTKTFLSPNYTENFVQSILDGALKTALVSDNKVRLLLGGDGRYFVKESLQRIIIPMCAANGVSEVMVGQNGIMSTPAASCVIRKYGLSGGILLTASHNPGGPDADFGIKYNCENGGPSPEKVTDAIYEVSKHLTKYRTIKESMDIDLETLGTKEYVLNNASTFKVTIISSVRDYAAYVAELFDFGKIRKLLSSDPPFQLLVTGLNGVMGPYIKGILCDQLGMPEKCALDAVPMEDFGGGHPDPNLTYAAHLVQKVVDDSNIAMAAAFDGDGDRNMLIGRKGFFVTPCDSLAVIADNADCIKYFKEKGMRGCARSMPTSRALDEVCKKRQLPCFEVPTGWKFFGNLMDANMCSLCGEESFGTGSDHIREKDGMWALLAWLSILADNREHGQPGEVESILVDHWVKYGRYYFTRYDYENCEVSQGDAVMARLNKLLKDGVAGNVYRTVSGGATFTGQSCENYSYVDPVDKSESKNQGICVLFTDGTRFVYRLSGTGSSGATVRIYVDTYEQDPSKHVIASEVYLAPYIELAVKLCGVEEITGRKAPTVIT